MGRKVGAAALRAVAAALVLCAGFLVGSTYGTWEVPDRPGVTLQPGSATLDRVNRYCTERTELSGDAAVSACDTAMNSARAAVGDLWELTWDEREDVWSFERSEVGR